MNSENKEIHQNVSNSNARETKLEKENEKLDDAQNDYHNRLPLKEDKHENTTNTTNVKDDDNNIGSPVSATQKRPDSSGAFPVGAFDTSKD